MPSRIFLEGETVFIRATVVTPSGSDIVQVLIDDGDKLSITHWLPSAECTPLEEAHLMKPIRRDKWYLDR